MKNMEVPNIVVSENEILEALEKSSEKKFIQIAVVGVVVQFLWSLLDLLIIPQIWTGVFFFRLAVLIIPILFCVSHKKLGIRASQCMFIAALSIALVSMFVTFSVPADKFNNYVLGDIVFFVGVGMLATWSLWYSFVLIIVSIAFASFIFYLNCPMNFYTTLTEGGFSIGSIAILSIVMIYLRFKEQYKQAQTNLILAKSNDIIIQKSFENNSLQVQLHEKEKSTLISEITASISHELNTPMSIILNGSKALKETTSDLITIMDKIESSQWLIVLESLEKLKHRTSELSSIKQFQESKNIELFFETTYSKNLESSLSRNMVGVGFKVDDIEIFEKICSCDNYTEIIQAIIKIKIIEDFNLSIENSIAKCTAIIYDLKYFVDNNSEEEVSVNLRESLENALLLFFQDINKDLSKIIILRNPVFVTGNEIKITQIWYKLIDYVCTQVGESKETVQIRIFVKELKNKVNVNFRFHQPVNANIQLLTNKNGSANQSLNKDPIMLNLSILQNLLIENNLSILLIDLNDEFELQIQLPIE